LFINRAPRPELPARPQSDPEIAAPSWNGDEQRGFYGADANPEAQGGEDDAPPA
jgi:hypothetical protein